MDPIFFYRNPQAATVDAATSEAADDEAAAPGAATPGNAAGPRGENRGNPPLRGLSVAIQSTISVRGWPTDAGSNALAGYTALEDATVVQRLRDAGAYFPGSTHVSEFGFGFQGSQAGGALRPRAAGALRDTRGRAPTEPPVDAELVLDLMGEGRLAAARVSVCGLKPSYGMVSRYGLIGLIPSMECCAILSESPRTIRKILQAIAGRDHLDFSLPDEEAADLSPQTIDPERTSIGVIREAQDSLTGEESEAFGAALDEVRGHGLSVQEMSLPEYRLFSLVHRIVGSVEASSATGRYDSVRYGPRALGAKNWNEMYLLSRGAAFGRLVKSYLIQGAFFQFERYDAFVDACRLRARLLDVMRRLTSEVDFLLLPVAGGTAPAWPAAPKAVSAGTPPSLDDLYRDFASTLFANVTGQPTLYLPPNAGAVRPGFQFVGPRLSDGRLLALGELILESRGGD